LCVFEQGVIKRAPVIAAQNVLFTTRMA